MLHPAAARRRGGGRSRKREVCHCPTNDPATCSTVKLNRKSKSQHLKHDCDYPGPCRPGFVGQCTPAPSPAACVRNSDCGGATPFCLDSVCVQCRNDDDCQGALAGACVAGVCDPAFLTCAAGGAAIAYVEGPDKPPVSKGSVQLTVPPPPASNAAFAGVRAGDFAGVKVADLTALTYSRYVELDAANQCPSDIPYMVLYLGTSDLIVSVPAGPFECEKWVTRDALKDNWWSPTLGGGAFAPVNSPRPLSDFLTNFDTATMTIRNGTTAPATCPDATGGLRIAAGEWGANGQTGDYVASISFLVVSINGEAQTFRF